jgi:hypothetical protein
MMAIQLKPMIQRSFLVNRIAPWDLEPSRLGRANIGARNLFRSCMVHARFLRNEFRAPNSVRFMGSPLVLADLLTGHEPFWCWWGVSRCETPAGRGATGTTSGRFMGSECNRVLTAVTRMRLRTKWNPGSLLIGYCFLRKSSAKEDWFCPEFILWDLIPSTGKAQGGVAEFCGTSSKPIPALESNATLWE